MANLLQRRQTSHQEAPEDAFRSDGSLNKRRGEIGVEGSVQIDASYFVFHGIDPEVLPQLMKRLRRVVSTEPLLVRLQAVLQ